MKSYLYKLLNGFSESMNINSHLCKPRSSPSRLYCTNFFLLKQRYEICRLTGTYGTICTYVTRGAKVPSLWACRISYIFQQRSIFIFLFSKSRKIHLVVIIACNMLCAYLLPFRFTSNTITESIVNARNAAQRWYCQRYAPIKFYA